MKKIILALLLILTFISLNTLIAKRAMQFEDMFKAGRLSSLKISPDGKMIVFVVTQPDISKNTYKRDIYSVSIKGNNLNKLTNSKGNNFSPYFLNNSEISFVSTRDGELKLYKKSLKNNKTTLIEGASVPNGFGSYIWTPNKDAIAFQTDIYPCTTTIEESIKKEKAIKAKGVDVKVLTSLMYRVWNSWKDGKKSHIFYKKLSEEKSKDLTPGNFDTPPLDLGGHQDFVFSPDGKYFSFVKNTDKMVAISTNNDIFFKDMKTGKEKNITIDNKANDMNPVFSSNGRYFMYLSMKRAGFEADKKDIILIDLKTWKKKNLTEEFKYTVGNILFSKDSKYIYFTTGESVYHPIYRIRIRKNFKRKVKLEKLIHNVNTSNLTITPNGKELVFLNETVKMPREIFSFNIRKRSLKQVTNFNKDIFKDIELNKLEIYSFKGAKGDTVEALMVKPPFFDKNKKYPVVFLIHGGPQGGFKDAFHYRWNQSLFAAPGFVAISINFHGSTGYGQKFTDVVSKDWGGAPFQDIVIGQKYFLDNFKFLDKNKVVAAGASYGGFMINWIAGHHDKFAYPFKALVTHDGIFDSRSMYYSTEELWFEEWENGGTQFDNPKAYEAHNPSNFVKNFKIPMLIVHGEKDFRVPVSQGIMLFTALQRRGIKSKFLYFPNEDHFVQKPKNARFWWKSVHSWFKENIK